MRGTEEGQEAQTTRCEVVNKCNSRRTNWAAMVMWHTALKTYLTAMVSVRGEITNFEREG